MAQYAITFDLSQRRMKDAGWRQSDITRVYNKEILEALESCGFTEHPEGSVYHTKADNPDPMAAIIKLQSALKALAPTFCQYVSSVHVFRMEEWSDITPLIAGRPAEPPPSVEDLITQTGLFDDAVLEK